MASSKPIWVGISPSDIAGAEHLFSGCITFLGSKNENIIQFHSLEDASKIRVNYNDPNNYELCDNFLFNKINQILNDAPSSKFLWQDQQSFSIAHSLAPGTIANNRLSLIRFLSDKIVLRSLVSRFANTLPGITAFKSECRFDSLRKLMPGSSSFVIQEPQGAGGYSTYLARGPEDDDRIAHLKSDVLIATGYLEKAVPLNQHIVILNSSIVILPPSVQIVSPSQNGGILYRGGDFSAIQMVADGALFEMRAASQKIGEMLRDNGYRGVAGIDYLIDDDEVFFVEINPRFQASTRVLNDILIQQGIPSVHELHLMAFEDRVAHIPDDISAHGAFLLGLNDGEHEAHYHDLNINLSTPDKRQTDFSRDKINIRLFTENLNPKTEVEPFAKLWRLETDRQIARYDRNNGVTVDHVISTFASQGKFRISTVSENDLESVAWLKFYLFAHGLRLTESALDKLAEDRNDLTIRDGIAGGLEIKVFDRIHVNVPIKEYFALLSPLALYWAPDAGFTIQDDFGDAVPIEILPIPDFAGRSVSSGTPMLDIGQMFNERLSIEIFFGCVNTWAKKSACHFCELGAERKPTFVDLNDTQELVAHCRDNPKINMRHILLGGGTPPDKMLHLYVDAAKRVRAESDVPLYLMMAPPPDLGILDELKTAGVDEVGFNIEVYDRELAQRIMPEKGKIPLGRYFETMEYAVRLWTAPGAVRSILIVGLEPLENTLRGVRELCTRGVMPILSPFRPIPGTPLANHPTPTPELLFRSWKQGQKIAEEYGLSMGPTCIACQNNTIAMPTDNFHRYY